MAHDLELLGKLSVVARAVKGMAIDEDDLRAHRFVGGAEGAVLGGDDIDAEAELVHEEFDVFEEEERSAFEF